MNWTIVFEKAIVYLGSIFIGFLLVLQTILNGSISAHFSIPILGSVCSFGIAQVILTGLVYIEMRNVKPLGPDQDPSTQLKFLVMTRWPSWFHLLPGLIGIVLVTSSLIITGIIGTALFFLPVVVGQIICSSIIDHVGIAKAPIRITPRKAFLLVCTLVGAALTVSGKMVSGIQNLSINVGILAVYIVVSFLVGLSLPFQAVCNRRVTAELVRGSKLQATWWSFFVGLMVGLVVLIIQMCMDPEHSRAFPDRFHDSEWYMYLGAPLGIIYVSSAIWFTEFIGFEAYFVCIVTGQLSGSMIFESIGLLTVPQSNADTLAILGICLVIVSVAASTLLPPDLTAVIMRFAPCCKGILKLPDSASVSPDVNIEAPGVNAVAVVAPVPSPEDAKAVV